MVHGGTSRGYDFETLSLYEESGDHSLDKEPVYCMLRGNLNSTTVLEIREQIVEYAKSVDDFLLDLSGIRLVTSTGVSLLVEVSDIMSRDSRNFIILKPSERVRQVIQLTGLTAMFKFADTLDESISMLKENG